MDEVVIEHNFTGTLDNYSITAVDGSVYYYNYSDLAVGFYVWRMIANDTSSNENQSDQWTYEVVIESSNIELMLNAVEDNITAEVYSLVELNVSLVTPSSGILELYEQGVLISNNTSPLSNTSNYTTIGEYNITALYRATRNYSASTKTYWVTVEDTAKPQVADVTPAEDTKYNASEVVTITANVTDNYLLFNVTADVVWDGGSTVVDLTDDDADDIFEGNFTQTITAGRYNVTLNANDTSDNKNDTETTYFNVLTSPAIETDQSSYIRQETVHIIGSGFNFNVNVTVDIKNSSNESVSGYPINFTSNDTGKLNDSWYIEAGQELGSYTINMTDTTESARTVETTFDVVTAVVEGNQTLFEQGQIINITGYSWDAVVNVTLNITDPDGVVVYGPVNVSSNSSGHIMHSWGIPYDGVLGDNWSLDALQPSDPNKNDGFVFEVVARPVSVSVDFSWYKFGESVNVSGLGFSPDNNVSVDITNSSGGSVSGYPVNASANSTGGINVSWVVPSDQLLGVYTVNATDTVYGNLNNSTSFEVVEQYVVTDSSAYSSGDTVSITGYYWDRSSNVTLSLENSSGHMQAAFPRNATANSNGVFTDIWTAQPGVNTIEEFNLSAEQYGQADENSSTTFDVTLVATLTTDKDDYDQNEIVSISGNFYTTDGDVTLTIKNQDTNGVAEYYPKTIQANSTGGIQHTWNTTDLPEGNYSVESQDNTYPDQLYSSKNFTVTYLVSNQSLETADAADLSGDVNINGGSYTDTYTSNDVFHWLGYADATGNINAWVNYTFDVSSLGVAETRITQLNFTMEYCHSGNQLNPECGDGYDHEGITNGDQLVELFNFTSGSWANIGTLPVDDDTDNEQTGQWLTSAGLTDFIENDKIYIRFELDFNQSSNDDALVVDHLRLNISFDSDTERSSTEFPQTYVNLSTYNDTYNPNPNTTINLYNEVGVKVDSLNTSYYRYLSQQLYDIELITVLASGTLNATLFDTNISSNLSTKSQTVSDYTNNLPSYINDITPLFALNDDGVTYDHAELSIPLDGVTIEAILHCLNWNYENANCTNWEVNDTIEYDMAENSSHLLLNVTEFDTFGGGGGDTLPNLTEIRVYNVTGLPNTHEGGDLIASGLNTTFNLTIGYTYRVEFTVRNDGIKWNIDAADEAYHDGLNSSWTINTTDDIWYTDDAGATNYSGGAFSFGNVSWDLSLGGSLKNGEEAVFYYVTNISSEIEEDLQVYFLVNDTSKESGSTDYSTYVILPQGYLEVNLTLPPIIPGKGNASNGISYKVGANKTFIINATVVCRDGNCGDVSGTLRNGTSGSEPANTVSTTSDTPFYITSGANPQDCSTNPLVQNESCELSWTVNASGDLGTQWSMDVEFDATKASSNDTNNTEINITKVLILSISWSEINFGVVSPNTVGINASLNNLGGYNITLHENSNDIDGLYIRGTNLSPQNVSGFGSITYGIAIGNISFNDNENNYSAATTERITEDYALVRATFPPGTVATTYFWADVPGGQYAQDYEGTLYVMVNAT